MHKLIKYTVVTVCISILLSFNVFATYVDTTTTYEILQLDLKLTLPEGTYIFTFDTPDNDPTWEEAGLENPPEYKSIYQELNVLAHFSYDNGNINVLVNKNETDTTASYFSLAHMTDEEIQAFIDEKLTVDEEGALTVSSVYEHEQIPFIRSETNVDLTTVDGQYVAYELTYFTLLNGYTVTFSHNSTEPIPQSVDDYLQELTDTVRFGTINEPDVLTDEEIMQARIALAAFAIALIAIIGFFIYLSRLNKRRKKDIKALAEQISQYRVKRPEIENPQGELVFENFTDLDDELIRKYSVYKAYLQRPIAAVAPTVLTLFSLIASFFVEIELLWILLIVAAFIYCVYKLGSASYVISKVMRKTHSKYRTKKAHYRFYEREFSVSGLQFAEFYPYFQITDFRDHGDYFFIYMGENNCYYVDKRKFTFAEQDDFSAFVKSKMGKKRII